jgi:phosphoglycolate phosphatase-like HAD superfamily hydrolase
VVDIAIGTKVIADVGLVIFDKDGTLIELYHYWSQMVALRARLIREALGLGQADEEGLVWALGVDRAAGRLRPEGPVGLKKREIVIQAAVDYLAGSGLRDTRETCSAAFDRADQVSNQNLQQLVKPIRGGGLLIRILRQRGCRTAIATLDRSERARLAMDALGCDGRLDLIVGAEQVPRPKPHPDMIQFILSSLAIDSSQAVMVGDALTDIQMGLNAGIKACVGVLTGFATREEMAAVTPYVAEDVSELMVR